MLSEEEIAILKVIDEKHLVNRSDLIRFISKKTDNFSLSSIQKLIDKGFIKRLSGVTMETSYIITQTGVKFLNKK